MKIARLMVSFALTFATCAQAEVVDPYPIAYQYQEAVVRPLKLEGQTAEKAVKTLVGLGLRCTVMPESLGLKINEHERMPSMPPYISCEKKLREDFEGYPRLKINLDTTWQTEEQEVAYLFAHLGDTKVTSIRSSPLVLYDAVKDPTVARVAQQDLEKFSEKNPLLGSAESVTSKLVSSGFSCGLARPFSTETLSIACSKPWPTHTCRTGLVTLKVVGPPAVAAEAPNLLWSAAHSIQDWDWSCLDPTAQNRRGDDPLSALGIRP